MDPPTSSLKSADGSSRRSTSSSRPSMVRWQQSNETGSLNDSMCNLPDTAEDQVNIGATNRPTCNARLAVGGSSGAATSRESITFTSLMQNWKKGLSGELGTWRKKQRKSSAGTIGSFSLGSMQYSEGDLNVALPLPGRESHTADLERFDHYVNVLRVAERDETSASKFNESFWAYMRTILECAKPVGYDELSRHEVQPKGPKDGAAFLQKMAQTDLINPIHPNLIADSLDLPLQEVVTELLHAVSSGMMTMSWGPSCTRCDSIACGSNADSAAAYCANCQYTHTGDALAKIMVIFSFVNEVFFVLAENFLSTSFTMRPSSSLLYQPVPATFTGSGFRYSVGCGGNLCIRPALAKGRFRMRCPVSRTDSYLVVEDDATDSDEPITLRLDVSDLKRRPGRSIKTVTAKHGKIHFDVFTDTQSFFFLWIRNDSDEVNRSYLAVEDRLPFTEATELMKNPTFQHLYGDTLDTRLSAALKQMKLIEEE